MCHPISGIAHLISFLSLAPSACAGLADIRLLFGRTAAVGTSHVLFLLGLGAYLVWAAGGALFLGASTEGDAIEYDIVYVVACEFVHFRGEVF